MQRRSLIHCLSLAFVLLTFSLPAFTQSEIQYTVIVNKDNPAENLSKEDVMNFMLKNVTHWDMDSFKQPVEPADLLPESPVRNRFTYDVMGFPVSSVKQIWQRQLFSGRKVPPPEMQSDRKMIDYVGSRPGGIGYVSSNAELNSQVKSIRIE